MHSHPLRQIIEACDTAISTKNYDALMAYYSEDAALVVKPGMIVKGEREYPQSVYGYIGLFSGSAYRGARGDAGDRGGR